MRMALLAFVLSAGWLFAQEAQAPPAEMENYRKQLSIAVGQKNPRARVKAIERFLKQKGLPAGWAEIAREELVRAVARQSPEKALDRAQRLAKGLKAEEQAELHRTLASALLDDGKQGPRALEAARRAASYPEASPRHQYSEILGLALRANGRDAEARSELEAALAANPSAFRTAAVLAELAEAEGRKDDAFALRAHAFLARPTNEAWERLTKLHGGSEGLDEYLDERYHALFPAPLHPKRFGAQAQKTVLAELYTGAGCPPCAAADLAFDAVLDRYARRDVAVVIYHVHVPRPDPMTNSDTRARWDWQKGQGVPTAAVDGTVVRGGGNREHAAKKFGEYQELLEQALAKPAGAGLDLVAVPDGGGVAVRAAVKGLPKEREHLRLQVVLVEKLLRYSGENGIRFHPMVARGIASFELNGEGTLEHRFDLAEVEAALRAHLDEFEKFDKRHNKNGEFRFRVRMDRMDKSNLAVVAYIQDRESREVLQSAFAEAALAERTSR
jgi:hypothetical protein